MNKYLFFCFFCMLSCNQLKEKKIISVNNFNNTITYIMEKDRNVNTNLTFKDLVVLDVDSLIEKKLECNDLLIKKASVLNEENIFLLRNRITASKTEMKYFGPTSSTYIYLFNSRKKNYQLVIGKEDESFPSIGTFSKVDSIMYFACMNNLLAFNNNEKSINEIKSFEDNLIIKDISVNHQSNIYAVSLYDMGYDKLSISRIEIYDLISNDLITKIQTSGIDSKLGNWNKKGTQLAYTDNGIKLFSIENKKIKKVSLTGANKKIKPKEALIINENEIYFIGFYKEDNEGCYEIFRYEIGNKKITQFTSSKLYKTELNCDYLFNSI